jgi:hypothetical protein
MRPDHVIFLQAVAATAAWVAGLLFVRFWRNTHDPLFAYFGVAFWLLSLSWAVLGLFDPTEEARPYVYLVRLVAFVLIIAGVAQKNRSR